MAPIAIIIIVVVGGYGVLTCVGIVVNYLESRRRQRC
jgi:hypothetical protein